MHMNTASGRVPGQYGNTTCPRTAVQHPSMTVQACGSTAFHSAQASDLFKLYCSHTGQTSMCTSHRRMRQTYAAAQAHRQLNMLLPTCVWFAQAVGYSCSDLWHHRRALRWFVRVWMLANSNSLPLEGSTCGAPAGRQETTASTLFVLAFTRLRQRLCREARSVGVVNEQIIGVSGLCLGWLLFQMFRAVCFTSAHATQHRTDPLPATGDHPINLTS